MGINTCIKMFENSISYANLLDNINIIENELILSDLAILEKMMIRFKTRQYNNEEKIIYQNLIEHLYQGKSARLFLNNCTDKKEKKLILDLQLLSNKPILYIANISDNYLKKNNQNVLND